MPVQLGTHTVPVLPAVPGTGKRGQLVIVKDKLYRHDGISWQLPPETLRESRLMQLLKNVNATTVTGVGISQTPSFSPEVLSDRLLRNLDDATGPWLGFTTAATAGDAYGPAHLNLFRAGWNPEVTMAIRTDPLTVTNVRYWVGLFKDNPSGTATPSFPLAALRYDAAIDGTTWKMVTSDGGPLTITDSAVPVQPNWVARLRFNLSGGRMDFFRDDTLIGSHSTNLPGGDSAFGWGAYVTTLVAERRSIHWGRTAIQHI